MVFEWLLPAVLLLTEALMSSAVQHYHASGTQCTTHCTTVYHVTHCQSAGPQSVPPGMMYHVLLVLYHGTTTVLLPVVTTVVPTGRYM